MFEGQKNPKCDQICILKPIFLANKAYIFACFVGNITSKYHQSIIFMIDSKNKVEAVGMGGSEKEGQRHN
jgi:hypothetical protein